MTYARHLSYADALAMICEVGARRARAAERVALREARGRVLADDLVAPMSLPLFENSAMDGFAVRHVDLSPDGETRLRLTGSQFAGARLDLRLERGECARITTGAALPAGADTIVIKEQSRLDGEHVLLQPGAPRGQHVRAIGEDVREGDRLFLAGATLGSAGLGLIAALGIADVHVTRRPSVAVFTTGDELRAPGSALGPGEIYDSNRVLLQSLLAEECIDTLAWLPLRDDPQRITTALADATQAYDLIITCGGVSAGEKDLLPGLLEQHGRIHFWKVMMRPGMPVLFGEWGNSLFLGLPGNPVSVLATFRRLARPLLDALQGRIDRPASLRARLLQPVEKSHGRLEFRRARLSCSDDGVLGVRPHPAAGSHQQRGAAESNALMLLPEEARELSAGELLDVEAYGAILRD